jgi:hypothetical protein
MNNSSAKLNIDHLVLLGFPVNIQAQKWRQLFKKNPLGKCMGCNNKIRVTDPISNKLKLKYYSHRHIPEVHWIFDFTININDNDAINDCINYFKKIYNNEKINNIYPCCYKCWNIAVNICNNYNTNSVEEYYENFKLQNPNYINWALITFEQCSNEDEYNNKKQYYYEYIKDWCNMVNLCSYTKDGLKYCGKQIGKCEHILE